jgi:hypothetical protein
VPVDTVETIPLYPRRRLVGTAFGGSTSIRRGEGVDVASSRPYQPGDHFRTIDWKSSARLASARGSDDFIVRERHAEEMPRVVLVVDRRPSMALYPDDLPWLDKPRAVAAVAELVVASALNQRGLVGYLDYGSHEAHAAGTAFWRPPRAQSTVWHATLAEVAVGYLEGGHDAPEDNVEQALGFLSIVRSAVPIGSFVFVVSDFLASPVAGAWTVAVDHGWDVVPVVVQDPTWEQSFPPLGGVLTPLADVRTGGVRYVRLSQREAEERREAHEARRRELEQGFLRLGLDAVWISDGDRHRVRSAFVEWAEARLQLRGQRL